MNIDLLVFSFLINMSWSEICKKNIPQVTHVTQHFAIHEISRLEKLERDLKNFHERYDCQNCAYTEVFTWKKFDELNETIKAQQDEINKNYILIKKLYSKLNL